jgi:hypothetical protein
MVVQEKMGKKRKWEDTWPITGSMGSWDDAFGIATRLRIGQHGNRGSIPNRGKSCFPSAQRRHRLWDPFSLLHSGYFNGDKEAGA